MTHTYNILQHTMQRYVVPTYDLTSFAEAKSHLVNNKGHFGTKSW